MDSAHGQVYKDHNGRFDVHIEAISLRLEAILTKFLLYIYIYILYAYKNVYIYILKK